MPTGQLDPITGPPPEVVNDERAQLLARHAIYVQGGMSTPEVEKARAEADIARGSVPDWTLMYQEVVQAMRSQLALSKFVDAQLVEAAAEPTAAEREAALERHDAGVGARVHLVGDPDQEPPLDEEPPPDDAAGFDIAKIRRYKQLRDLEAAAGAEAKAMKAEADALEGDLVDMFGEAGMQNINIDGKTVYLNRTTFAQRKPGVTTDDIKAALLASGNGDLITETINANTLSAFVRELLDDDNPKGLPEELEEILELGERFRIGINASGSKPKSRTHSK